MSDPGSGGPTARPVLACLRASGAGPYITIAVAFLASRALIPWLGVTFAYQERLHTLWQVMDVVLLRDHPLRTLWHMHAQPPLFNALIALVLQLPADDLGAAFALIYSVVTLAGLLGFYTVAVDLLGRRSIALAITLVLAISPATILYERTLMYEGLVTWILVIGFACLWQHLVHGRRWFGFAALSAFAAVVLIRAAFHPIWLLAIVALMLAARPSAWRATLAGATLPVLLVAGVVVKNEVLFARLGLSSWMGMSLFAQASSFLPPELRASLIRRGKLSPAAALPSFSPPAEYLPLYGPMPHYDDPVLDNVEKADGNPNYNHIVYALMAPLMTRDALVVLRACPLGCARAIVTGFYHFTRPTTDFKYLEANLRQIALWDRIYSVAVWGQPAALFGSAVEPLRPQHVLLQVGYLTVAQLAATAWIFVALAWRGLRHRFRRGDGRMFWLLGATLTIMYVTAVTNIFDTYETNRSRSMVEPLIFLVLICAFAGRGGHGSQERAAAGASRHPLSATASSISSTTTCMAITPGQPASRHSAAGAMPPSAPPT
ncbi:MAG: hypothetical protein ACHQIO_16250 [Nevskiales bacterium]